MHTHITHAYHTPHITHHTCSSQVTTSAPALIPLYTFPLCDGIFSFNGTLLASLPAPLGVVQVGTGEWMGFPLLFWA